MRREWKRLVVANGSYGDSKGRTTNLSRPGRSERQSNPPSNSAAAGGWGGGFAPSSLGPHLPDQIKPAETIVQPNEGIPAKAPATRRNPTSREPRNQSFSSEGEVVQFGRFGAERIHEFAG